MKATLTDLHRKTGEIVRPVIHAGETVVLTANGKDCAKLVPCPERRVVSLEEWCKLDFTDEAILDAVRESRE